jgi:hypothetical protein
MELAERLTQFIRDRDRNAHDSLSPLEKFKPIHNSEV